MGGCLLEYPWRISYGPADDRLRDFYVPALSRSVLYERSAGFFSSTALAVAAAGVAHLVRAGGRMRLLVGAALSEEDVRAIERGTEAFGRALEARLLEALADLSADPEDPRRLRLEVLAWMVAQGTLEIKVVLPIGEDGRPRPAAAAAEYFHAKEGLFTDACGHQLAFSGSVNETAQGWERNYEQFMVYRSWDSSRPYLLQVARRLGDLWRGREEGWIALPVPDAVRHRLLEITPSQPPEADPLEGPARAVRLPADQRERILLQFLRDAPYLPGGERVGLRTAGFTPWPHQARIASEVIRRYPERFLLADEVGLGKTVEAGLVLRALLLSGAVRRCLILVPKSVLRQWQEELYEKFSLNVPVYDGQGFEDYFRTQLPPPPGNPWDAYPVVLASSQLAKRAERRAELLSAGPFDLIVVDEAHHARRREFATVRYRPNRLLSLLEGEDGRPGLAGRTRGLLLLTATPMQIHPVEVYDLLRQLDLPPAWAASEVQFLRFLAELRRAAGGNHADWAFILRLARGALDARSPEELLPGVAERLGWADWAQVVDLVTGQRNSRDAERLAPPARAALLELCRRASPLGTKMFRTTRELLRRYRDQGLLAEHVPTRDPLPIWIDMSEREWELYGRVEDYVHKTYQRLEGERKGLGFIATVYRRRLTSSFAALRRTLERRRDFLMQRAGPVFGMTDEDIEDAALDEDREEELEEQFRAGALSPGLAELLQRELEEIDQLLAEISRLPEDTKFRRLLEDLRELLGKRETAAVFTHYTDTMDDLRDRLAGVYGERLACYSGRGGERFRDGEWVPVTKEVVKNAFRSGEISVLLCTEAASEGLNLQTCGVLINYDVPWNPMRIEQRIGRFDRIGQRYPDVWIRHYFLRGPRREETVEARVYRALEDRIDWFRTGVGELQPILARVERTIERAAVATGTERDRILAEELAAIRREVEAAGAEALDLAAWAGVPDAPSEGPPPVTLAELEGALLASSLKERFSLHPNVTGAWRLDLDGQLWEVTFDAAVADAHPGRIRLLTYGEQLLERLLELPGAPASAPDGRGLIRVAGPGLRRWYAVGEGGTLRELRSLAELRAALDGPSGVARPEDVARARERAAAELRARAAEETSGQQQKEDRRRELLAERGRLLLAEAAAAKGVAEGAANADVATNALLGAGYPWAGLAKLVGRPDPVEVASFREGITSEAQARARLRDLRERGGTLLAELVAASHSATASFGRDVAPAPTAEPTAEVLLLAFAVVPEGVVHR